ncbi:MAG: hypothetical protein QGG42_17330 [Phycisphaerae bacterium]|jgi:hypothetical protein|nr:hypothetical protein [Phycisphaerae bacterium]
MSYDLAFWNESPPQRAAASGVYGRLIEDEDVPGVIAISVSDIVREFQKEFPEIEVCNTQLNWEGSGSYFQVSWAPDPVNAVFVNCGWDLLKSPETMNRIIDVGHRLGCPLYDPQEDRRYPLPGKEG